EEVGADRPIGAVRAPVSDPGVRCRNVGTGRESLAGVEMDPPARIGAAPDARVDAVRPPVSVEVERVAVDAVAGRRKAAADVAEATGGAARLAPRRVRDGEALSGVQMDAPLVRVAAVDEVGPPVAVHVEGAPERDVVDEVARGGLIALLDAADGRGPVDRLGGEHLAAQVPDVPMHLPDGLIGGPAAGADEVGSSIPIEVDEIARRAGVGVAERRDVE